MKKLHDHLILAYVISSILATLCLIPYKAAASWFYLLGSSSSLYALGYVMVADANPILGIVACGWIFLFPVLMIIFYILTKKEIYLPFLILVILDVVFVLVVGFDISSLISSYCLADAIVSTVFTLLLGGLLLYRHNHLEKYL